MSCIIRRTTLVEKSTVPVRHIPISYPCLQFSVQHLRHSRAELLIDMLAYGVTIGGICLSSSVLVIWGFGRGDLGAGECNDSRDGCEVVFRARATCFASVSWTCLLLAWEMVDLRRSLFWMRPNTQTPYTQWIRDLWANQVLFWSVVLGFVTTFPIVYIPVINDKFFLHAPISWEVRLTSI